MSSIDTINLNGQEYSIVDSSAQKEISSCMKIPTKRVELCTTESSTSSSRTVPDLTQFSYLQIMESWNSSLYFSTAIPVTVLKLIGTFSQFDGYGNVNVTYSTNTTLEVKSAYDGRKVTVFGLS